MAYRDSTTNNGTASSTPSTAVPAGVAIDDIVILAATIDFGTDAFDPADWPTGFTELSEVALTGDGHVMAVGWKRLTGVDSGSYTFGSLGTGADWDCQAYAFSGRHTTNPPVVGTAGADNGANPSPVTATAGGVTAVDGDDLLFICAPDPRGTGLVTGHSPPTLFTEAEDFSLDWSSLAGAYRNNVGAGATGAVASTFTLASGTSGSASWLIRIPTATAARRWILGSH